MSKICKITLSANVSTTKQNHRKHSTVLLREGGKKDFCTIRSKGPGQLSLNKVSLLMNARIVSVEMGR